MILMLAGEGKTDLGQLRASAAGLVFEPGPMAWIVDQLLASQLDYSLIESHHAGADCVVLISESELAQQAKAGAKKKSPLLPGIKHGKNTGFFTRNAQALGRLALEKQEKRNTPTIAVLFRDADASRSMSRQTWREKVDSVVRGFKEVQFDTGVPMIPRPKSEAWILCALKNNYLSCEGLEDAPGNDASPNSLKNQLEQFLTYSPTAEQQAEWVLSGKIDPQRIMMPSFLEFKQSLADAIEHAAFHR